MYMYCVDCRVSRDKISRGGGRAGKYLKETIEDVIEPENPSPWADFKAEEKVARILFKVFFLPQG